MNYIIQNEYLKVQISNQGAELQSILGKDGTEYLWQGNPSYWPNRALNIFPYVARLTDNQYEMDGKRYQMRIHGLALYEPFSVTEHTKKRVVFALSDTEELFKQYPRHFTFQVSYSLRNHTLEWTYRVFNQDEKAMYFGLGAHPGFRVPLEKGRCFEDYRLRFSEACSPDRIGFTAACFLDGTSEQFPLQNNTVLPLTHDLFDRDAIVLKNTSGEVTLEADNDPCHSVTVRFPDMPYLGIWHKPNSDAPYICIEPWSSLPSTQDRVAVFEQQEDLLRLEPGQQYQNTVQIMIGKELKA